MTLPPWLWRILRSRKTRRAGIILLCLLFAVVAGFYPVTNWWGRREFEKAEAEVRARGFPVPERQIRLTEIPDSLFSQPGYLAEVELPVENRLGAHNDFNGKSTPQTLAFLHMGHRDELSPDQIAFDREWLSPFAARRAALIQATRQATPLAAQMAEAHIEIPDRDFLCAIRLARFLRDDAALAKAAGDSATAFESMEAYFRIMGENLMPPRMIHLRKSEAIYEISEMVTTAILGAGCRGYDENQLAKLETMLAGVDFQTTRLAYFREMPGDCIAIHRKFLSGKYPDLRPRTRGLFSQWSWDQAEIHRRAGVMWEAWKPSGLYEVEMASSLRRVADLAEQRAPASLEGLRKGSNTSKRGSRLLEPGRLGQILLDWRTEAQISTTLARHLVALERHRLRHGSLPSRLEDLDADLRERLPMDAFSGKPLDYAVDGKDGFKLGFSFPEKPGGRAERRFR